MTKKLTTILIAALFATTAQAIQFEYRIRGEIEYDPASLQDGETRPDWTKEYTEFKTFLIVLTSEFETAPVDAEDFFSNPIEYVVFNIDNGKLFRGYRNLTPNLLKSVLAPWDTTTNPYFDFVWTLVPIPAAGAEPSFGLILQDNSPLGETFNDIAYKSTTFDVTLRQVPNSGNSLLFGLAGLCPLIALRALKREAKPKAK